MIIPLRGVRSRDCCATRAAPRARASRRRRPHISAPDRLVNERPPRPAGRAGRVQPRQGPDALL